MSEFEREDRYAVIKYKKLTNQQWTLVPSLLEKFDRARVDCVVVEKDWPEYNFVWLMLEHRMAGFPVPDFNAVKCAADVSIAQAELETAKATIARLEREQKNDAIAYKAAIEKQDELRAEIERLKSGQGEPFCFTTFGMIGISKAMRASGGTGRIGCKFEKDDRFCVPVYTEQPAPVSPLAKGFITLETGNCKYKIVTAFANRDDAWAAYTALVSGDKLKELNP
jgi:hypothetical protein